MEDTCLEVSHASRPITDMISDHYWDHHLGRHNHVDSGLQALFNLLSAYSERSLSYCDDRLRALWGVTKLHVPKLPYNSQSSKTEQEAHNFDVMGLPSAAFDFAMCWQPHDSASLRRYSQFPSWTVRAFTFPTLTLYFNTKDESGYDAVLDSRLFQHLYHALLPYCQLKS